jgi:immunity protein, SdpI family
MRIRWYVEAPQWLIIAAMFAIAVTAWNRVPLPMPVHWVGNRANGYGGRFQGLLLVPILAIGVYLLLLFAPKLRDGDSIAFSGTTLDPDTRAYRWVIEPLYHLVRFGALMFLAITYAAQVRFAEGYPVNLDTIDRDGVLALIIAAGIMAVASIFLGKPKREW